MFDIKPVAGATDRPAHNPQPNPVIATVTPQNLLVTLTAIKIAIAYVLTAEHLHRQQNPNEKHDIEIHAGDVRKGPHNFEFEGAARAEDRGTDEGAGEGQRGQECVVGDGHRNDLHQEVSGAL